jgi:hypothetical protein
MTVLKVLAGQPEGRASVADLTRATAILMSSGADWTNRMKGLARRSPDLDIFSQSFVLREDAGWQITSAGREFLASLESRIQIDREQQPEEAALAADAPLTTSPIRIASTRRRNRRGNDRRKLRIAATLRATGTIA